MVHAESARIVELARFDELEIGIETYTKLTEGINDFSETELARPEQFHDAKSDADLIQSASVLLS